MSFFFFYRTWFIYWKKYRLLYFYSCGRNLVCPPPTKIILHRNSYKSLFLVYDENWCFSICLFLFSEEKTKNQRSAQLSPLWQQTVWYNVPNIFFPFALLNHKNIHTFLPIFWQIINIKDIFWCSETIPIFDKFFYILSSTGSHPCIQTKFCEKSYLWLLYLPSVM